MLLIAKDSFRELVSGSDDILAHFADLTATASLRSAGTQAFGSNCATIDAGCRKRIVFTANDTNVTLGPVTVHPPDLAVLA
jgi:hypothetical protein